MLLLCNDLTLEYFDQEIQGYLQKILRMPVLTMHYVDYSLYTLSTTYFHLIYM